MGIAAESLSSDVVTISSSSPSQAVREASMQKARSNAMGRMKFIQHLLFGFGLFSVFSIAQSRRFVNRILIHTNIRS